MLSFLKKHLDYVCYVKLPSLFFLCSSENKDTITTWWANERTWEIKHFIMHYWLIHIWVFCSRRFCYGSVCWSLAWILNCATSLPCSPSISFILHGQEAKWRLVCLVGWPSSDVRMWGARIESCRKDVGACSAAESLQQRFHYQHIHQGVEWMDIFAVICQSCHLIAEQVPVSNDLVLLSKQKNAFFVSVVGIRPGRPSQIFFFCI